MKMSTILLLIGIIAIGIIIFAGCKITFTKSPNRIKKENEQRKLSENPYSDFRNMAFSTTPEQLDIEQNDSILSVYGCIVDWCPGQNVVTIVSFQTGDVSMYLSSGQIYIGGSGHESIRSAGLELIKEASLNLNSTHYTNNYSLPSKDNMKLYLVTNKGKYLATESFENMKNEHSIWLKSFNLVNNIISNYRQINENQ